MGDLWGIGVLGGGGRPGEQIVTKKKIGRKISIANLEKIGKIEKKKISTGNGLKSIGKLT